MKIAVTGGTGFVGRYIVNHLLDEGHDVRLWHRPESDQGGFRDVDPKRLEFMQGELDDADAGKRLVDGVDGVVHAALNRTPDPAGYVEHNVLPSVKLMQQAHAAGVGRFVFISTCAVHDVILDDRELDEAHPLWPRSTYGAHKAAIEKFVHSMGLPANGGRAGADGWNICALRPSGVYGLRRPLDKTKWHRIASDIKAGKTVDVTGGGKEVHAADVAKSVGILLTADGVAGQSYNCCDRYISYHDVAHIAKELSGSSSEITSEQKRPKNEISTKKIEALGMKFGGETILRQTISELLENI